jgi:hypothetical protein
MTYARSIIGRRIGVSADRRPFWERSRIQATDHSTPPLQGPPGIMQTLALKASLLRAHSLRSASVRTFVSSAARWQAVPTEKPVLQKEFKIYRWVGSIDSFGTEYV